MELKKKFGHKSKLENKPLNPGAVEDDSERIGNNLPPRKIRHSIRFRKATEKSTKHLRTALIIPVIFLFVLSFWLFSRIEKGQDVPGTKVANTDTGHLLQPAPAEQSVKEDSTSAVPNEEKPVASSKEEQSPTEAAAPPPMDNKIETESKSSDDKRKGTTLYTVQPGDTLYRISLRYYHTGRYADYLAKYNHLKNPSDLIVGRTILVPDRP